MTHDLPCLPCPMTSDDFSAARKNGKCLACERMYDEMVELRELVHDLIDGPLLYAVYHGDGGLTVSEGIEWAEADMRRRARELGVDLGVEVSR